MTDSAHSPKAAHTHRETEPAVDTLMDRIKAATGAPAHMTEDQLVNWLGWALDNLEDYRDAQMVMNTNFGWRSCRRPERALGLRFDGIARLVVERRRMAKANPA